ncbi:hypothetical protein PZ61_0207705 [Streptomyces sp. MNU77]|nr:hypothetical protein PZ61_0207705 [Streptomyces sp. MNU77]
MDPLAVEGDAEAFGGGEGADVAAGDLLYVGDDGVRGARGESGLTGVKSALSVEFLAKGPLAGA